MKPATSDDVFYLLDAYVISAALGAAIETGLFWFLAQGPLDAFGVAQALEMPVNRCHYWLQMLSSIDLLEQTPDGYRPSPTAQTAILDAYSQDTWAFLARESRERFPAVMDLACHIRAPGSAWDAQGLTPPDYFENLKDSRERARQFTRMLYEIHLPLAEALAEALDMQGVERLLDLGGGSGVMSMALLRKHLQLTAVVFDIPNVCAAGHEIAIENRMEERLSYHEGDFEGDELPSGFDLAMECDVGYYTPAFLSKVHAALNPGGRLVIVDKFAPTKDSAHLTRLHWALLESLENPNCTQTTAEEVESALTQTGFELLSTRALHSREDIRWSSGWVMIEARK